MLPSEFDAFNDEIKAEKEINEFLPVWIIVQIWPDKEATFFEDIYLTFEEAEKACATWRRIKEDIGQSNHQYFPLLTNYFQLSTRTLSVGEKLRTNHGK